MFISKDVTIPQILSKLPKIIEAAISEKNRAKMEELIVKGGEMKDEIKSFSHELITDAAACASLILEILREPLEAAGYPIELEKTRNFDKFEMELYLESHINALKDEPKE